MPTVWTAPWLGNRHYHTEITKKLCARFDVDRTSLSGILRIAEAPDDVLTAAKIYNIPQRTMLAAVRQIQDIHPEHITAMPLKQMVRDDIYKSTSSSSEQDEIELDIKKLGVHSATAIDAVSEAFATPIYVYKSGERLILKIKYWGDPRVMRDIVNSRMMDSPVQVYIDHQNDDGIVTLISDTSQIFG